MGRLKLAGPMLAALLLLAALPAPAFGFTGFSNLRADATFGEQMTFSVDLAGGAPDELELLLRFAGGDSTLVAPVQASGSQATYIWDASERYVTPNTEVDYQWRATDGGRTTLSAEGSMLYDDDRPGLDWQSAVIGQATVHWYGGNEGVARHLGELTAGGAAQAEELLGHEMDGPVDIFIYEARDDFFGALGPGAREWFGAATFPPIRTIFLWLGAGPSDYLETTVVHEVTHVVFSDSTENPFHNPAKWLNEGLATWSEQHAADAQRATVQSEASGEGLFSFDAITYDFPFGSRGATLSYAMGTTMVDMIIDGYGEDAIAQIAEAYRAGASDDEALEGGTGVDADELYADFYDAFGVDEPGPVEAVAIPPSDVDKPGAAGAPGTSASPPASGSEAPADDGSSQPVPMVAVVAVLGVVIIGVIGFAAWRARPA
ncbi:MAG TPA: peptidase MA family metallohydrolase [Candidatus Limnocylindria bacterium]